MLVCKLRDRSNTYESVTIYLSSSEVIESKSSIVSASRLDARRGHECQTDMPECPRGLDVERSQVSVPQDELFLGAIRS